MTDNTEIAKLKLRLDATFERVGGVSEDDTELQSDLARYLCVLVSGFLESALREIVLEHIRECDAPTLKRFVERKTRRIMNVKIPRLKEVLDDFDPGWKTKIDELLADEQKDAVNSIVDQRNRIAHGGSSDLTYRRIREYYRHAQDVIDSVATLFRGSSS